MPANAACALAATLESFGAKPSAPPPAPELIAAKRPCSICDKSPVKFATERSASANTVGSSTATCVIVLLPTVVLELTNGAPPALTIVGPPPDVLMVSSQLPPAKLTILLVPVI